MKTIAALIVDLDKSPIGTASRLAEPVAGAPVLRRTVDRLQRCRNLSDIVITAPPHQCDRVRAILAGTNAVVEPTDTPTPPYQRLVAVARKWSLDSWRGGLGGSAFFDEHTNTAVHTALARQHSADAVAVAAPGSALIDPAMLDAMVEHHARHAESARLTFAQAPPGLAATIIQTDVLAELAAQNAPPGWGLAYKPDAPSMDVAFRACCYAAPPQVRHASGRLTADTARSVRTIEAVLATYDDPTAAQVGGWLTASAAQDIEPVPHEVEVELTTDDPLPETRLRPRGDRVPSRGPLPVEYVDRIARELSADNDDALVVLGGYGDPVLHPRFAHVLGALRRGGVFGICVYTTGQSLGDEALGAIIEHQVDVVVVHLDAHTPATYRKLNGGELAVATGAVGRLITARTDAGQPAPIVLPQMTKCVENVEQMDAFFDDWTRKTGCAVIAGYSNYAGRLDDLAVTDTSPPQRAPCRRLRRRCVVLADGSITACDQDVDATLILGHLGGATLADAWRGPSAARLRAVHDSNRLGDVDPCNRCTQWHRR